MKITRVAVVAFPLVLLCARHAGAGICELGRIEIMTDDQVARAKAASPPPGVHDNDLCFDGPIQDAAKTAPKVIATLLAACTAILDKRADDDLCPMIAAYVGRDRLGAHDIVAAIAARPNKIFDTRANEMFGATGAARAEPILIARWQELEPIADAKPNDGDLQNDWAVWRTRGALALGAVGGAAAEQFLKAELDKKIDRGVKSAARAAIEMIDARQHAQKP